MPFNLLPKSGVVGARGRKLRDGGRRVLYASSCQRRFSAGRLQVKRTLTALSSSSCRSRLARSSNSCDFSTRRRSSSDCDAADESSRFTSRSCC